MFSEFMIVVHAFDNVFDRAVREPFLEVVDCNLKLLDREKVTS